MRSQQRRISFEFFPPKTDKGRVRLTQVARSLSELNPQHVSVTFGAGGSTREGTYQTVRSMFQDVRLKAAPHISCIGSSREQIREMLRRYAALGVDRVVALRGDAPSDQPTSEQAGQDFRYANELVRFVREVGGFKISVGCYPEFHPEAPDPETDLDNFVRKVEAGADDAITQYFFNNEAYYSFVDNVRRRGVDIPVIAGLMPITDFAKITRFSSFCGADIPLWIRKRMESFADDPASQRKLGIEIAVRQAEDLLRNGVPGLHVYTLNQAEPTLEVWRQLGLDSSRRRPTATQAAAAPG